MRTTVLLPFLALATLGQAQVFTSGFENWADTVPADWMGNKTTLHADSVEQVSTDTHGGSFAVRLKAPDAGHKRFTTQGVNVVNGTVYEISFWVRGTGEIRTGLYDGRADGSGYATYNSYFTSTGNTWSQVTQQITCTHDTTGAQFILSVHNSAGPEHLVVDDVNIAEGTVEPPVTASVYQIQYTTDQGGASQFDGAAVITGGIVTGVDTIGADSYFIQAGSGPWSAVYVYDQAHAVAIGDSVVLTATVDEFSNATTELVNVTEFTIVSSGNPLPAPQLLNTSSATEEQWEGVLATIADAECTSLPDQFGEWGITQPSGAYLVDDLMYIYAPEIAAHYDITGCVHYANGAWKIEPRFATDIVAATAIGEHVFNNTVIGPNPATDVLRVSTGLPTGTRVDYMFTDALGRTVRTGRITGAINVADLTPGLYHLTLRTDTGAKSFAVVVR